MNLVTMSLKDKKWKDEQAYSKIICTRYFPRELKMTKQQIHDSKDIDWLPQLAPSRYLLRLWKNHKITEQEFERIYTNEIMIDRLARHTIALIYRSLQEDKKNILLCYERDGEFCHRHILKRIIEESGKIIAFESSIDLAMLKLHQRGLIEMKQ